MVLKHIYSSNMGVSDCLKTTDSTMSPSKILPSNLTARPFHMRAPGLFLTLDQNGEITALKDGKVIFELPAPHMESKETEYSYGAVSVKLEQTGLPDNWLLTYTPDERWLDSATYPVTLDPAVCTVNLASAVEDTFVTSKYPLTVQDYTTTCMRLSQGSSSWGTSKAYVKFLDSGLPSISSSYYVTKAYFRITTKKKPTSSASVYLHEVLSSWSPYTITYNNQPSVSSMPLDYTYMGSGAATETTYTYDISNLVRKWYTGTNHGLRLESTNDTYIELYSSDYAYAKPYVVINYVSLAGLEGSLAYENQSAGRAGVGHVSLYNGNLIFEHQDTACNGNLMPVSLTHYYNSCYYKKNPFGTGFGWTFSGQQYLHREVLPDASGTNVTYYVYTDSDGTRHFFRQISGEWKDLSGLSLKLTISGSTVTIKDKGDNSLVFDLPTVDFVDDDESTVITGFANVKPLKNASDACGNTVTYSTDSNRRITNIKDGANRNTVFTISGTSVTGVQAPGSGSLTYTYNSAGYLTSITHEDAKVTNYTYNAKGLLSTVVNHDGLTLTYSYYETRTPYRVSRVEISNGNVKYGGRKYEYGDCMTIVTDLAPAAIAANNTLVEGKSLIYHFNDYGNVVSVNDQLGYACFAKYSNDQPVNHPQVVSKMQRSVVNLLKNHGFESTGDWSLSGNWSYATDNKYMGSRALKITTQGVTAMHTAQQSVAIKRGKPYTLSFYVKKSGDIDVWAAYVYTDSYGVSQWVHAPSMKPQLTEDFTRLSYTFTPPANALSDQISVVLCAGADNGIYPSAWFDCVQLEEGVVANRYNMLINGDFTFNSGTYPAGWLKNSSNTGSDIVYTSCTGTKPEGLSPNTMRMYGAGRTKYAGIYQDINMSGAQGDVFSAGGWSFNYSKPHKGEDFRYNIRVAFLRSGTSSTRENSPSIEWSEEWTD